MKPPADKQRKVIDEIKPELGHRRPYVRAALDLAQLVADDPGLNQNRVNGVNAFLLAGDVLMKARYRLPSLRWRHALDTARSANFGNGPHGHTG
ncbi:MAG: hypothetical protein AAF423_14245 [Pseudomonadota bacterium]